MYGREIDGGEHTFGVSGKLIMNSLVMYDRETETLWSQFLGRAVEGPLAGAELEVIPVTQTTWSAWRELHPDTTVLRKPRKSQDRYAGYYSNNDAGVLGESSEDDRLGRKELVLGVDVDGSKKAYAFSALEAVGAVSDSFAGRDLLVFLDPATGTGLAYDRRVNGRPLSFQLEDGPAGVQTVMVDEETGSRWRAFTGRAFEGELKGQTLARLTSHLSFWFAWKDWYPETELYTR